MSRYNEKDADCMDRLIHSALIAAAERFKISKIRKLELLGRLKSEKKKIDRL